MHLSELQHRDGLTASIEVFPPKSAASDEAVHQTLEDLRPYDPAFVSVTYGAGGSTQTRTLDLCEDIRVRHGLPVTSHLTCVGATKGEIVDYLTEAAERGVANVMALRGDAPEGQETFTAVDGGLSYANELVALIRDRFGDRFGIGVAGYPETHLEAVSPDDDLARLRDKVDAGADAVFTQLFYVNDNFFRFVDQCRSLGVEVPIVAGIMPITNYARIQRITKMCGAVFPDELSESLAAAGDDADAQFEIGVDFAVRQCRELIDAGVEGIHFYALNKSRACSAILDELGLAPAAVPA